MKLSQSLWLAALLTGCVATPAASDELTEGKAIERLSEAGLVSGRLTALGTVSEGSNDFELELFPTPPYESATLGEVVAVMPNHGHRSEPARLQVTDTGCRIVDLSLGMPGVWQLQGELVVDQRADEITFEVDVP